MAPTGLRISCAMLADSRPSPASLDCWILAASSSVSSRKTMTGEGSAPPSEREMRLDDVAAVGGDEGLRGRRGVGGVLPPGFEQIEQLRRSLAEQRARIGAAVAEQLRRGFVDQADAVLVVDHHDALAQVLHDVLRKLREIGEVHLLAPHGRFAYRAAGAPTARPAARPGTRCRRGCPAAGIVVRSARCR